ncbi:MAG TPA: hypothetical protein VFO93_13880 [Hymenobacter sp.]|uniref:hypothetical protein n=1 Tax=Hymenobacter sp. TaxID=1898978 RepID=UPI002D809C36|nr:hypothetical protein [Hymenobacter sp.]HET9504626.1 hypothetical protein [Hymenobacter sp.]
MRLPLPTFVAAAALAVLLGACQGRPAPTPTTAAPALADNYFKVSFNGQTRTYADVSFGDGQLGALKSLHIAAGSTADAYLTLDVFGRQAGTFPYRQALSQYEGVSQAEYKIGGKVFASYKALVCPTSAGYYSTQGQVVITEYVPGQRLRGTFAGALLDQDDPDQCSKQATPFSGEFCLTKN